MPKLKNNFKSRGYIALISVIILGAIGTAVDVSVLLLSLNASRTSLAYEQSNQAQALANACVEQALNLIKTDPNYTGSMGLIFGLNSCDYNVTNQGGQTRQITASGSVASIIRKVSITTSALTPQIVFSSWQEVAD